MGILDDAIKQHLELKRRRGADPTEIERLEREALGPVRRLQQETPDDDEPMPGQPGGSQHEPDAGFEEGDEFEDYEDEGYEDEDEYPATRVRSPEDPSPVAAGSPLADDLEEPEDEDDSPPPRPEDREESRPRAPVEHVGVETAEYDVEAEHAREESEEDREGEDVLEETPEFFQDAPDHDRLWFEQRPPKDFDFDG